MKVSELIEELKKFPADLRVVVNGYEGGFSDPRIGSVIDIELDVNSEWFYGPHDKPGEHYGFGEDRQSCEVNSEIVQALWIMR